MAENFTTPAHLLIVEDDRFTLNLLQHGLLKAGYSVSIAKNGEEGLRLVAEAAPDMVLLDITLPGFSGLDVAKRLRDEFHVPFMFLSGHSESDRVAQATQYGALGYLVKPMQPAQIVPSIEAALARAGEIKKLREAEFKLAEALTKERDTSVAVGILMERLRLNRHRAFTLLRDCARSKRAKLDNVAGEVLEACELLNDCTQPKPPLATKR
ncbi:MAG: ANTAR domain-containing response regulator [Burkholderiales bacterium]